MKAKTFTVPFARVVGDEATELEFGPEDYLVIRPIFSMSAEVLRGWVERINGLQTDPTEETPDPEATADQLVLDLLDATCEEWHLEGPEGPISQPKTRQALLNLPGAITGSLFPFLSSYRGDGPNPTTRS